MTPKSASELSLVEAVPLPARDSSPQQAWAAISGTGRARLPQLRAEIAKIRLTPPPYRVEAIYPPFE